MSRIFTPSNRYKIEHYWPQIADAFSIPEDEFIERLGCIEDIDADRAFVAAVATTKEYQHAREQREQIRRWRRGEE